VSRVGTRIDQSNILKLLATPREHAGENLMNAIIDRLQFQLGAEILPDSRWKVFLDEVRAYTETVEHELRSLRENRDKLLAIIDLIPVAFFVKDNQSRFFLMNRACEFQWGLSFANLRDNDGRQFFPPDQMDQFLATDRSIFEIRQPVEFEEEVWSAAHHSNRMGYTFKRPMYDANGNPEYLVCVTLDITDRKRAEAALLDSEIRLRETITHSPNPMLMHAEDGNIIMMSAALSEITGYRLEDLPNTKAWAEKAFGLDAPRMLRGIATLYDLKTVRREGEYPIITATGETLIWEFQSQPLPKLPDGRRVVLSLGVDVTERRRLDKDLQTFATTDSLTNLPNRRHFLARLTEEFLRVQRLDNQRSSVLMLDLDLFKEVNDTYGHAAGDGVLKNFARQMRNTIRKIDTAGRLGGEEFAIILPGADLVAARASAERLREIVATTPFVQDGKTIPLTVSIGVATMGSGDCNEGATLIRADGALYRAKRNGRNRVEVAETDNSDETMR
jgi:diguanylate cyclase (GGDEF)-like protein/PAS domain S-box-containing protein